MTTRGSLTASAKHSQLGVTSRVRHDPLRRQGNANAVAVGINLSCVGVMSDRELEWIMRLAYDDDGVTALVSKQEAQDRLKALSDTRKEQWSDTVEARQHAFLATRAAEAEEAERRRRKLDELYEEQEEQQRLARVAQLELQHLRDDPRGRNLKKNLALHEAIKAREEQIAFKNFTDGNDREEEQRERREREARLWGEIAEEERKKLAIRQRNVEEKNTNLEAVLYQIDQRRQERAEEKGRRKFVDEEAEDERRENEAEEAERRAKEAAFGLHNKANSRPHLSRQQRLQQRVVNGVEEAAELQQENARSDRVKQEALERRKRKADEFEKRKLLGLDKYMQATAEKSPTFRTQDCFETKGVDMIAKMDDADKERVKHLRDSRIEMQNYREPLNETTGKPFNRAAATASGFHTREEEQANLVEMRKLPELVRAEMEAEAAARKAVADRVAMIQKMQAAEKKEQKRREDTAEVDERRQLEEWHAMDDERYANYIRSQLPEDMSPFLKNKACEMALKD